MATSTKNKTKASSSKKSSTAKKSSARSTTKRSRSTKSTSTQTKTPEVLASPSTDQVVTSYPEGAVPSEIFPGRRATDVDIAEVDPGNGKGEHLPPLNAETWVVLDGKHKLVPDEYDGSVAAVVDFPVAHSADPDTGEEFDYLPPKGTVTVRVRSQGTLLHLPMDAFKEVHTNGRPEVLGFA